MTEVKITDEKLIEIEAAAKAATPGPWEICADGPEGQPYYEVDIIT